jgi:hypothetical protein
MAVPTKKRPARSDAELQELIALIEGADSVELKLTLLDSDQRSTVTALALDPLEAQIRQVFFFDTPDLTLSEHGVVVRARRVQRKGDDSVVKLRPVVPGEMPDHIQSSAAFGVEVDASPEGFVCSGSMKGVPAASVREAVGARRRCGSFSQRSSERFSPSTLGDAGRCSSHSDDAATPDEDDPARG